MSFKCQYWDCGWCYKSKSIYENGCVGSRCKYIKKEKRDGVKQRKEKSTTETKR